MELATPVYEAVNLLGVTRTYEMFRSSIAQSTAAKRFFLIAVCWGSWVHRIRTLEVKAVRSS